MARADRAMMIGFISKCCYMNYALQIYANSIGTTSRAKAKNEAMKVYFRQISIFALNQNISYLIMGLKSILYGVGMCAAMAACTAQSGHVAPEFVTVRDGKFYRGDSVYRYIGTNLWYGAMLGIDGPRRRQGQTCARAGFAQGHGHRQSTHTGRRTGPRGAALSCGPVMQYAPGSVQSEGARGA